jgi:enolase-phosphatase E1
VTVNLTAANIRAVLLDIEGTTTPVEFVYDVLFPFARAHIAEYLERERNAESCRASVALLRDERGADLAGGETPPESIAAYAAWLMDRDRKSRGLKALQGLIWQEGYRRGELRGQVFPDVRPALERWNGRGLVVYIYSSGSVLAQQLLFSTTDVGDLTKLCRGYFDTAVGPKASPDSYRLITSRIGVAPAQVLFVSDVVAELDAAREAALKTALCVRSSGSSLPVSQHPVIRAFDDIVD